MHMLRDGSRRLISLDENDETGISRQGFETRSKSLSYGTAPCLKFSALMPIFSGFSPNPKIRFTCSFVETKIGNRLIFFFFFEQPHRTHPWNCRKIVLYLIRSKYILHKSCENNCFTDDNENHGNVKVNMHGWTENHPPSKTISIIRKKCSTPMGKIN